MATTSLWHISGNIKDLIDYVENPEKTRIENHEDFWSVLEYVKRPEATKDEYITGINCLKETALKQMILTKKRFGKENGYIAWHGYQSFAPGEVSYDECHRIGVETAKEMWGDKFQIIVSTHMDKEHPHNHFCINSVSFIDGSKYNYSKSERRRFIEVSDRICLEHGLSVIKNHNKKAPSRTIYFDEKSGKPTRYNVYREDIREAALNSRTPYYMEQYLIQKGYITDFTGKHWKLKLPQYKNFTRLDTLDERWTPEYIRTHMGGRAIYGNIRAEINYPMQMPKELKEWFVPFMHQNSLYKLYLHYCYLLGVLPKGTKYKPKSPYLKEDIRKMEELSKQAQYLGAKGIETFDDLYSDRDKLQKEMDELIQYRTKLQNKIRRAKPEYKEDIREEKTKVTKRITKLRNEIKMNEAIEKRSAKIEENTNLLYANEYRAKEEQQKKKQQRGDCER